MMSSKKAAPQFSDFPFPTALLDNLKRLGYKAPTPIQTQSLPDILDKKDIIAQAKTGSGKTAAFALGLLHHLKPSLWQTQALILCPTRELADQVSQECRRLARCFHNIKILTLCGGQPFHHQKNSLQHGAHIIVGTPGRLLEHQRKGNLKLDHIQTLVLDEADRMLDMGFLDSVTDIIKAIPTQPQTLLFSATFPEEIKKLSQDFQNNPQHVHVESLHDASSIQQHFFEVKPDSRIPALLPLLQHYQPKSAVLFCNTKQRTQDVAQFLSSKGFPTLALHGDMEQKLRDQVLVMFANHSCRYLVATDVAARGLDIKDLPMVINIDLSRSAEVHTHRIGRTGRSGASGIALSLYQESENYKLAALEQLQGAPLSFEPLPPEQPSIISPPPQLVTLEIQGGKKMKLRPGDILGALTQGAQLPGQEVGQIHIFDFVTYVAISQAYANQALKGLSQGKIKGKSLKVRKKRLPNS